MKVVIIDYGAGNVKSVQYAFNRIGVQTTLSAQKGVIENADKVIFPGVGAAAAAMDQLDKLNLIKTIGDLKQPVLGICLGMQLLAEYSEEGETSGLGILKGRVRRFNAASLKVPQMGWNKLNVGDSKLFSGLESDFVYYVNSYYLPVNKEYTVGVSEYGVNITGAIEKNNFYGCQFHPEKSGEFGEKILKNFIDLCD